MPGFLEVVHERLLSMFGKLLAYYEKRRWEVRLRFGGQTCMRVPGSAVQLIAGLAHPFFYRRFLCRDCTSQYRFWQATAIEKDASILRGFKLQFDGHTIVSSRPQATRKSDVEDENTAKSDAITA